MQKDAVNKRISFCWGFFSCYRLLAIIIKEFIQMRRDRVTFALIIGIPLMQLILFGYAINTDPKHLPTVVVDADNSAFTRSFLMGLENTEYLRIIRKAKSEKEAKRMLELGDAQFLVSFPVNFTRDLLRGNAPQLLIEADATDPVATGSAISAIKVLSQTVFNPLLIGSLQQYRAPPPAVNIVTHALYNPENMTRYNIVPGLIGVVVTMTMVIITSMCITREREKGTMEHLLSTPVRPLEVMIGKILPYIIMGYIQIILILVLAKFLFTVPMNGSVLLLLLASLPFIIANLSVGLTFSSMAKTQLQASQMAVFFFLPSLLLSGFMFPFRGMPMWAQYVGNVLPLTHYLHIVRGIVLKGNGWQEIVPSLWPIIIFMIVAMLIGLKRYRQTLD